MLSTMTSFQSSELVFGIRIRIRTIIAIIFNCFIIESLANQYKIVKTLNGDIRGFRNVTIYDEKPFYSFRGIQFGQPPLAELRFKPPVPIDSWIGVKDAFEFGSQCMQLAIFTDILTGSEDCLYLNIYVPENLSNEKLAVMFFIHGGAYTSGSADLYGSDLIINNNVILVTINYRLSVFGFMSLGNAEYSGNMGLKDQWLALKWVNDNIEFFGGDKSRITIFGHSAGGASVGFHLISPKSRGLFKRAILQSGCVLSPWAFSYEDSNLRRMKEFANLHGNIKVDDDQELISFLKSVDADLLITELWHQFYVPGAGRKLSHIELAPVKEVSNALDPFLTEFPEDVLKRPSATDIDTMIGFTSAEMIMMTIHEILYPSLLAEFDKIFEMELPKIQVNYDYNSKEYKKIAKDIRKFYFPKNSQVGPNTLNEFVALLSDIWFNYGIINAAKLQHRHSIGNTYLYQFSLKTGLTFLKSAFNITVNINGAAHADELLYLFRLGTTEFGERFQETLPVNSLERKSIQMVVDLWTNFAKYGSPTMPTDSVNFKPIENNVINYGDITNDGLIPKVGLLTENIKFWDNLYS